MRTLNRSARRIGALVAACAACLATTARGEDDAVILSETGYWRQHLCFGPDSVSPAILKTEGEKVLGANAWRKLQADTESALKRTGVDPSTVDWRERVLVRLLFDPYTATRTSAAPDGWQAAGFDDTSWVLRRGLFQNGGATGRPVPKLGGWTRADLDEGQFASLGVQTCCYRARFIVEDPANKTPVTLRMVFRGGIRAFVNGQEVARAHLPQGVLSPDSAGDDYPVEAYQQNPELRDRALGPVTVPPALLKKGVNVLAVEVRASRLHPVILGMKLALHDHKVRQDKEGMWPHACLSSVELRGPPAASPLPESPATMQAWVIDAHHRVDSTEQPAPGEPPGPVRFVAALNATFSAQLAVRAGTALAGLQVRPGELRRAVGGGRLSADAMRVFYLAPYPKDDFSEGKLGDERGLDATFPDNTMLTRYDTWEGAAGPWVYDRLTPTPPARIPANTCVPIWLSLRVPADAVAGAYRGTVEVTAQGMPPVLLPVEAEIVDWRLLDPGGFQTFAGCEENPYGVAKQYGIRLWSEEHWRLIEASLRQLGRIGNDWWNVPVISRTEFGNLDDSMIRWVRGKEGALSFDYAVLDRYIDLAVKHCGRPQVVNVVVMQGMRSALKPPAAPKVAVFDEASGKTVTLALGGPGISQEDKKKTWCDFATALRGHMKARGFSDVMYWGFPLEQEDDPELKGLLEACVPDVFWAAGPHETLWNATYANDRHYRALATVRYQPADGGRSLPLYRVDRGWKSPAVRVLNPRVGGNFLAMHTVSHPFAYRVLADHALARGHRGFGRIGADEWAAVHYDGMEPTAWLTGMSVLFTLWPGRDGAESSARFEALLEGIQEAEARIFIERALDGGRLAGDLAQRARDILSRHLQETSYIEGALCVHELEQYYAGWQDRSLALYRVAAETGKALR